jgi:hypothetical protein
VQLRALVEDSQIIADAVARTPDKNFETGCTSLEWFTRRIKNQRMKNRTVSGFRVAAFFLLKEDLGAGDLDEQSRNGAPR